MAKGKKPANRQLNGKSQDKGPPRNSRAMLKLDHLQRLAEWAGGEASIPSLGAFLGRQFATAGENLGVPADPLLIPCQRCETILQPGFNCTIRIEKNRSKAKRKGKKSKPSHTQPQNNVVYTCHFCSFRNQKRGTPKGHLKDISPPEPKPKPKPCPAKPVAFSEPITPHKEATTSRKKDTETTKLDDVAMPAIPEDTETMRLGDVAMPAIPEEETPAENSPKTPIDRSAAAIPLLEALRRKRNRSKTKRKPEDLESAASASAALDDAKTSVGGSRKKRKSWTSLKEIAKSNENDARQKLISSFVLPLTL
ncbi:hypothetical protein LINPERHAP1_LOCUS37166 [Linum perenne]